MDLNLTDKVACITGGSRRIGFATAEAFAKEKARVVICGRQPRNLKDATERIGAALIIEGGSFNTSYVTELHLRRESLSKQV